MLEHANRVRLVGRDAELSGVEEVLRRKPPGTIVVLIEGEPGIGKTSFWQEVLHRADDHGYRVISCRPAESEAQLAFTALTDLLAEAVEDILFQLPGPQQHALEVALLRAEPGDQPPDQRAVAMAFLWSLRRLAAAGPLVVAVDDVQWLDSSSAAVLEFALRRLRQEPVVLLLTLRSHRDRGLPLGLERALDSEQLTRLRLTPLSLGAMHRLLREAIGTAFPRPVLLRLHDASRGNPLFALELARALHERGRRLGEDGELPLPPKLDDLLYERVASLSVDVRQLLAAAAMLADPAVSMLERALACDINPPLAAARAADVVSVDHGRIRFSHPLLASACLAHLEDAHRRELHRRLADVSESVEERARHLALAADAPDSRLASLLEEAATASRARGAWLAAAELLEHARRLSPSCERRSWARRSATMADILYHRGDKGAALRVAEEVIEHAEPGEDRALALALWSLWDAHRLDQAEQALAEAGPDPAVRARVGLMTAITRCVAGDLSGSAAAVEDALADARRACCPELIVQTLTAAAADLLMPNDSDPAHGLRADQYLREAARIEEGLPQFTSPILSTPKTGLAYRAVWAEDLDEGRRLYDDQATRVSEVGDEGSLHQILWAWSDLECRAGNLGRALELASDSYAIAERNDDEGAKLVSLRAIALYQALAGPLHEARATLRRAMPAAAASGDELILLQCRAVAGLIDACAGDHAAVLRRVATLPEDLGAMGRLDPAKVVWVAAGEEIEARIALGQLEVARERVGQLEERSRLLARRRALGVALRGRGLLLAAEGDTAGAVGVLEASLQELEAIQAPFERARSLVALGKVRRRAKHKRAAREALEAAVEILERIGAAPWAANARAELRRIGGRSASTTGELTATERRVADLVAKGRTNREVAAALFITPRTVEWNLTKIYAKTGVRSRAELAHVRSKASSTDN